MKSVLSNNSIAQILAVFGSVFGLFISPSLGASQAVQEASWSCKSSYWKYEPVMDNGIYKSTRSVKCFVPLSGTQGVRGFFQVLQNDLEHSKKFLVHSGPVGEKYEGMPSLKYEVTEKIGKDEDDSTKVKERVVLASDQQTQFTYEVKSEKIDGEGNSSYLRELDFEMKVHLDPKSGGYEFEMANTIHVKRPWFALAPVFFSIAKQKAIGEFDKAHVEFLKHVVTGTPRL